MKRLLLLFLISALSVSCFGQLDKSYYQETSQTGGRFEIIQSPLARRITLRLDKYFGIVYLMAQTDEKDLIWEKLDILQPSTDSTPPNKINYQIFCGGSALKDVFLININTGETWVMSEDPGTKELFFRKFKVE